MVEGIWAPIIAGILAGLGVAMPLGAIGALLLREGLVNGFRVAAAAAAGVATVDVAYCAVATLTGTYFARTIESHRGVFLVVSGLLIVGIGIRQLRESRTDRASPALDVEPASAPATYVRFVSLTAVNPLTLIYFTALGGAVSAPDGSWTAPAVFVAAVGLSSLGWQLVLASAGSLFRRALNVATARIISVAASLIVLVLGGAALVSGIRALVSAA